MKDDVIFKGNKDGLTIILGEQTDFNKIKYILSKKINENRNFFDKSDMNISFKGRNLNDVQYDELKTIVSGYGLKIKEEIQRVDNNKCGLREDLAKIIKGTVRSGQRIEYKGNVVILGDVNPGAEIIADGNIIVMGIVRGNVYAGCHGNFDAIIAGYRLEPLQIGIADILTRSPDNDERSDYPEYAYIKDGSIFIEKL